MQIHEASDPLAPRPIDHRANRPGDTPLLDLSSPSALLSLQGPAAFSLVPGQTLDVLRFSFLLRPLPSFSMLRLALIALFALLQGALLARAAQGAVLMGCAASAAASAAIPQLGTYATANACAVSRLPERNGSYPHLQLG